MIEEDVLPAGARVGRFVIIRLLGAGGMGVVYEARDPELNRKVALKVLRRSRHDDSLRLLREAQALAQLQHPNVVAIHDVGISETGVLFIAMELVDGENLGRHLAASELTWPAIVALYVQAGRGLAAAHAKSIVHRDFKPANVLCDRDGRVRVGDFGLARVESAASWPPSGDDGAARERTSDPSEVVTATDADDTAPAAPGDSPPATPADAAATPGGGALASPITRDGALLGTPRYMAPEQRARRPATAKSDQYSFCLCLWEALFGDLPPRRPSGSGVPRWLVRTLTTGLAEEPSARHPSMAALLDDLERTPRRRRIALAVAALGFGIAGGGWMLLQVRPAAKPADPCRDIPALAGWNDDARAAVNSAFTATGLSFAPAAFDAVAARLDDHVARWHTMRRDNCRATRVVRSQSEALLDARNLCLDRRADEVSALVAALRTADRDGIGRAADAVGGLGDLAGCADAAALAKGAPLPTDPARAAEVRLLEQEIATLSAELDIGRVGDREPRVNATLTRARGLGHPPLVVSALSLVNKLHVIGDRWPESERSAHEAMLAAESAGDDETRFRLATQLIETYGFRLQRGEDAAKAGLTADALIARLGATPVRAARLACARALDQWASGAYAPALEQIDRCIAERERAGPRDEVSLARAMHLRAIILEGLGQNAEALTTENRAIALTRAALGERHPNLARMMNSAAVLLREDGRLAESEAMLRQVLAIQEEIDPASTDVGSSLQNLGNVLRKQRRLDEATVVYRRGIAIYEAKMGPMHNRIADALDMLGLNLTQSGQPAEGEAAALRSLAIREGNGAGEHPSQAAALRLLGKQYRFLKQPAKALPRYQQALVIVEKKYGKDSPLTVSTTAGIGETLADLGRDAEARVVLERALALTSHEEAAGQKTRIEFALARALWSTPSERPRARALAESVLAAWKADKDPEGLEELEAWLASHTVN